LVINRLKAKGKIRKKYNNSKKTLELFVDFVSIRTPKSSKINGKKDEKYLFKIKFSTLKMVLR